jgi:hypothetical protein
MLAHRNNCIFLPSSMFNNHIGRLKVAIVGSVHHSNWQMMCFTFSKTWLLNIGQHGADDTSPQTGFCLLSSTRSITTLKSSLYKICRQSHLWCYFLSCCVCGNLKGHNTCVPLWLLPFKFLCCFLVEFWKKKDTSTMFNQKFPPPLRVIPSDSDHFVPHLPLWSFLIIFQVPSCLYFLEYHVCSP